MTRVSRILPLALAATLALAGLAAAQSVTYGGSVEGANGRGATVTGSGSYDPATGRSRSATVTTNNGTTVTRDVTADCQRNGSGLDCARETSRSGPRGTSSGSVARSYDQGSAGTTATRTGPEGRSVTRQRWITVNP